MTQLTTRDSDHLIRMTEWMINEAELARKVGMNVGQATLIVCRLDALAAYYAGSERESGVGEREFVDFVGAFMHGFMVACRNEEGSEKLLTVVVDRKSGKKAQLPYPRILYKLFRCGFVHDHLAKPGTAIIRDHQNGDQETPYLSEDPKYGLVINLDRLREDFVGAVEIWRAKVETDGSHEQAAYKKRLKFILGN